MTHEQKQQKLREWLTEIAKACGLALAKWQKEDGDFEEGCYFWDEDRGWILFDPGHDDRDSALVRRVFEIDTEWEDDDGYSNAISCFAWLSLSNRIRVREPHDGTPDSMGEAERWAAIQAAAKKLRLE